MFWRVLQDSTPADGAGGCGHEDKDSPSDRASMGNRDLPGGLETNSVQVPQLEESSTQQGRVPADD